MIIWNGTQVVVRTCQPTQKTGLFTLQFSISETVRPLSLLYQRYPPYEPSYVRLFTIWLTLQGLGENARYDANLSILQKCLIEQDRSVIFWHSE